MIRLYRIAICEDEKIIRGNLCELCRDICSKLSIDCNIFLFENSETFWDEFSKGTRYDLLLLDVMMEKTNGMELAKNVREFDVDTTIIFITSNSDFALQGYDVKAMHYLIKPPDSDVLEKLIASDYQRRYKSNFLVFKSGNQILRIPIREIIYLETVGRKVEITLNNGKVDYPGKLSDLIDGKEHLIRCHKAFALNITAIRELTRTDAISYNKMAIPVSRTFIKAVQQALLKQIRDV